MVHFLLEGIACGGLFSGADDVKSQEQRDRYLRMLGGTLGWNGQHRSRSMLSSKV